MATLAGQVQQVSSMVCLDTDGKRRWVNSFEMKILLEFRARTHFLYSFKPVRKHGQCVRNF